MNEKIILLFKIVLSHEIIDISNKKYHYWNQHWVLIFEFH